MTSTLVPHAHRHGRLPSLRRALPGTIEVLLVLLLVMMAPGPAAAASVTVKPGESLSAIAARHGVSVAALASANGIRDVNVVVSGTRLTIPAAGTATGTTAHTHTVRPGESLSAIAARYGVSAAAIASGNGITDPDVVVAGSRLRIPGSPVAVPEGSGAVTGGATLHRVRRGESLSAIAARYGVSVPALATANRLRNHNVIVAGRILQVPGAPQTSAGSGPGAYVGTPTVPRAQVAAMITAAAGRYGVDPALARAIAYQESGFNHNVRSHVGAIGAMQLMPYTAAWVGPSLVGRRLNPHVLQDNIDGGVAYLAWLYRRTGDRRLAAAGYYQGLNALRSRGMFDDTKLYVAAVMGHYGRV